MKTVFTIVSSGDSYGPDMTSTLSATEIEHRERIAHLLRRTTLGPAAGAVEARAERTYDEVLDETLTDTADRAPDREPPIGYQAAKLGEPPATDDEGEVYLTEDDTIQWWLDRLRDPDAGLHERMVWYWHGHFTSHIWSGEAEMMWNQHRTIRRFALGNFRDLTREILRDPLMLVYLNGDGSRGDMPNENLARELMELFTLGVGNYTEDDVKAGARALSGWYVDWEDGFTARFDPDVHYSRPVTFLGTRGRFGVDEVVDAVCDHPSCATHVATRLHAHLVGAAPDPAELDRLARVFRAADLEILPLVAAIVRGPAFEASRRTKPRQPVEWLVAALSALGADGSEIDWWSLQLAGQVPFMPPNVAGWPDDERWLGGSQILGRVNRILEKSWDDAVDTDIEPTVDAVLERCNLWSVSEATRSVLDATAARQSEYDRRLELLFALALCSPEFALA